MNDLTKQMAPIRDTIARTREKMEQIERLLITATEADKLDCTSAAECAVEKARRLLGEMQKPSNDLKVSATPSPVIDSEPHWSKINPGDVTYTNGVEMIWLSDTPAPDTIDRTLPPGFEVRKFTHGWYPCCDFMDGMCRVYISGDKTWTTSRDYWTGDCGYPTESAAYADKARWLKAAGVDWPPTNPEPADDEPRVTGPHEDGNYDIRTSTHWWDGRRWYLRDAEWDTAGAYTHKQNAERALATSAACRAWVEMQQESKR